MGNFHDHLEEPATPTNGPSKAIWGQSKIEEMIRDPAIGYHHFDDFTTYGRRLKKYERGHPDCDGTNNKSDGSEPGVTAPLVTQLIVDRRAPSDACGRDIEGPC